MCRCFCNCKILHVRPCCVFTVCCLLVCLIVVGVVVTYYWSDISGAISGKNGTDTWTCYRSSCRNCEDLAEPSIQLNSTICTNITYLSEDNGFSYFVTVNNSAIFNETLMDLNPSPVCFEAPYVEDDAKVCIRLYNVNASHTNLHVCAIVEATRKLHFVKKYEFGCFDVYPMMNTSKPAVSRNQSEHSVIVS